MNKHDSLSAFIKADSNIISDCKFLFNYIASFLYKTTSTEKMAEYYNSIPMILDKIFGVSNSTNSLLFRNFKKPSLVDILNSEKSTFEDFDILAHLCLAFTPDQERSGINKNLFSTICYPPVQHTPDYIMTCSIINESIQNLLNSKKENFIITLPIFEELTKPPEVQKSALEKGNIVLSLFEYYVIFILIAIKDSNSKDKINLAKFNSHFDDFPKSYNNKKLYSNVFSKELLNSLETNRSLKYNFYLFLFTNLFSTFSQSIYLDDYNRLQFMVSAIDFVWLSEYFITPSQYISRNSFDIYSFFFGNVNRNITLNPPNLILIDCLYNAILDLQNNNLLFQEDKTGSLLLRDDALLFRLQRPLFYFFKTSFLKFSKESSSSELGLVDVCKLWFAYITPWMNINNLNQKNEQQVDSAIQSFIINNILFYTEIFNDYINAFSNLNVLNKNELCLLIKVLDLYNIDKQKAVIGGKLKLDLLDNLSKGNYNVTIFKNNLL